MFIFSGSGGGWNTTLSLSTDFSQIWNSFKEIANRTQPTGFSSDNRYIVYMVWYIYRWYSYTIMTTINLTILLLLDHPNHQIGKREVLGPPTSSITMASLFTAIPPATLIVKMDIQVFFQPLS